MNCTLEILIYKDGDFKRESFILPSISAELFEVTNMKPLFRWPEGSNDGSNNFIRIWNTASPETKEEEQRLIEMGKWGSIDYNKYINQKQ